MNPVFVFLVVVCFVCTWAFLSFAYKVVGKFFSEVVGDVKKEMKIEKENNNEE